MTDYNKRERSEAKKHGHTPHKNSGRGMVKGDSHNDEFVIDYKFAEKSFTLNKDVWAKVVTDSLKSDKTKSPALMLVLGSGQNTVRLGIIEWYELERLTDDNND